jgi:hypothetical protein
MAPRPSLKGLKGRREGLMSDGGNLAENQLARWELWGLRGMGQTLRGHPIESTGRGPPRQRRERL